MIECPYCGYANNNGPPLRKLCIACKERLPAANVHWTIRDMARWQQLSEAEQWQRKQQFLRELDDYPEV